MPFKVAKIFTRILSLGARFSVEEEEESSSSDDSRPLFGRQTSDVEDSSAASTTHLTPAVTRRTRSESPALTIALTSCNQVRVRGVVPVHGGGGPSGHAAEHGRHGDTRRHPALHGRHLRHDLQHQHRGGQGPHQVGSCECPDCTSPRPAGSCTSPPAWRSTGAWCGTPTGCWAAGSRTWTSAARTSWSGRSRSPSVQPLA